MCSGLCAESVKSPLCKMCCHLLLLRDRIPIRDSGYFSHLTSSPLILREEVNLLRCNIKFSVIVVVERVLFVTAQARNREAREVNITAGRRSDWTVIN